MKLGAATRKGLGFALAVLATCPAAIAQETERPAKQVQEIVTVTATRLPVPLQDLAGAATVTTASEISLRPSLGLDEARRWEPSFSLLRRTPARAAHPTAQGLNLRGIAPSGTSRALVLIDGAPATDAFGGWVYWNRVPLVAIEQVEIASGGGQQNGADQSLWC